MGFYKCKNILVTGGTGLIGRPLVDLLIKEEANVTIVSLDQPKDLSEKVTDKKSGISKDISLNNSLIPKIAAFKLSVSKVVSGKRISTPASYKNFACI